MVCSQMWVENIFFWVLPMENRKLSDEELFFENSRSHKLPRQVNYGIFAASIVHISAPDNHDFLNLKLIISMTAIEASPSTAFGEKFD
jgi:hypothetical protein